MPGKPASNWGVPPASSTVTESHRKEEWDARYIVCLSVLTVCSAAVNASDVAASIAIKNASFEAPAIDPNAFPAWPAIDGWLEPDLDAGSQNTSVFANTATGSEDHIANADGRQLARVGSAQAQSDYYYRHASVALLTGRPQTFHIRLSNLGRNSKGQPIAALATDVQFLAHSSLAAFQVKTRTSHQREASNVLFAAGNVSTLSNRDDAFTVDIGTAPYDALERILTMFEHADEHR